MPSKFSLELASREGETPILRLAGRLDADAAQDLRETAMRLKDEGRSQLIINLERLEFVASSGLGTMLLLTEEFTDLGGSVVFVAPGADVLQVIQLLNIDQFLTLVDSEAEAREIVLV